MIPLLQRHDQGRPALLPKLKLAVFGSSIARSEQFEDLQRHGVICGTRVAEIRAVEVEVSQICLSETLDEVFLNTTGSCDNSRYMLMFDKIQNDLS